MKMMKKLAVLGLAIALTLGMSTTAMAATITVEDTVEGGEYTAYKIFDAVKGAGTAVSYKIPAGSTIESTKGFNEVFTTQNNGGDTYVWQTKGVADSKVVEFLETYLQTPGTPAATKKAEGNSLTFENLGPGYYYVKSTVQGGAVVMLGTAADTVTIYEKNSTAGWGDGEKTADGETYNVGDTINYTLNYNNAVNYNQYTDSGKTVTEKVYQYVVKDTLPAGIKLDTESIKVIVNEKEITHQYKTDEITQNGFKITIPWAATQTDANDFYYDAPATIKVTYSAKMVQSVVAGEGLENEATINPNTKNSDPGKTATVYTGQLTVNKVDGAQPNIMLKDAEFKIINTAEVTEDTKYLAQDSEGAFKWSETAAGGTTFTTDDRGNFVVNGLKAGDYWLLETKAPAGYNLMQTAKGFTIALDDEKTADKNELLVTATVENNAGTELPSTGGIGTTIFYVGGGILVAVALILLVTKKRMSSRA